MTRATSGDYTGTAAVPTKAQRVSIEVELNLRIPTLTLRSVDEPDKRIDNSTVRFSKAVNVPTIPKTGLSKKR